MAKKIEKSLETESEDLIHPIEESNSPEAVPMKRSRLQEARIEKSKHTIILLVLGAIALIVFVVIFGMQLLINFSLFIGKMHGSDDTVAKNDTEERFTSPPTITASAKTVKDPFVSVSGESQSDQTIELYVNNSLVDKKKVDDGKFSFTHVPLKDGENTIKAKAIVGKNESDFSDPLKVIYRQKAPDLTVDTPKDGDAFSGSVNILKVTGKTAPYAKVTINGAWAIMDDSGTFRYDYRMQSGDNTIKVVAADEVGNTTEKDIKFTYSP